MTDFSNLTNAGWREVRSKSDPQDIAFLNAELIREHYQNGHTPAAVLHDHTFDLLLGRNRAARMIDDKWSELNGSPGPVASDVYRVRAGGWYARNYQDGAIFASTNPLDQKTVWVRGAIYVKYQNLGGESGFLGLPETDELDAHQGGRFTDFQFGSICWHPKTGAHEIHGLIRAKWLEYGRERFGYPSTDETPVPVGPADDGRYNHFRAINDDGSTSESSIYWSPDTGAHAVYGAIREHWAEIGWETSYLRYPTSDESDWTDPETGVKGRIMAFEHGSIAWTPQFGIVEFPEKITLDTGHLESGTITGFAQLTLCSNGKFHFTGHLHNDGFLGLAVAVASSVQIPGTQDAIAAIYDGNVGGTTSPDNRNEDFAVEGYDYQIRAFWDRLRTVGSISTRVSTELGAWEVVVLILLPVAAGLALITILQPGPVKDPPGVKCLPPHPIDKSEYCWKVPPPGPHEE